MKFLTEKRFSFVSAGLDRDTFGVVHFTGTEALSSLYEFNITLVTDDPNLDLDTILRQPATFTIHRPNDQRVDFNGILSQFEQLHAFNDCIFYRAQLRPRLWWLTLTHHNQVCLNLPVVPSPQGAAQASLIGQVLMDGGLTPLDFAFRTQKNYPAQEYVCQYDESHYAFMARWLEREGLYYFFEQTATEEKVVITDSLISHVDLPQEGKLIYAPPSGLDEQHHDEVIKTLICRQKTLPQKVLLRDHNYQRPTLEITGMATVDPQGRGESYVYGDYFPTPEEGNRLAAIYAESLLCRKREFFGESTVPFIMPGYTFSLEKHYRRDFNRKYLVCEVHHEGNQTGYLVSGLQGALADAEQTVSYRNTFTAIPAETQFRAERITAKPRISGTLHAMVDAEGSGEYAELDDQGRYKVRLPFDINDQHGAGKASCYLRMAQPYAGPKRGMHFPLPKGTEVLLTFIGGDPDRPVIASAVPNPETPSPSTARNQTESVIQTGGDNKIRIEDMKGKERIILQSPTADSWVRIGAPNDPPPPLPGVTIPRLPIRKPDHGLRLHTTQDLWLEALERYGEYRSGYNEKAPTGKMDGAPKTGTLLKNFDSAYKPTGMRGRHSQQEQTWNTVLAQAHIQVSSLDTVKTQEGNIYDFGGYWQFNLGNSYVENHSDQCAELNIRHTLPWPSLNGWTIGTTIGRTFLSLVTGTVAVVVAKSKSPLKVGLFLGAMGIAHVVFAILQRTNAVFAPVTYDGAGGIDDLIEGSDKFASMAAKEEFIQGKNLKLRADRAAVTKTIEEEYGGEYSYSKHDSISITIGNTEEHNRGDSYTYTYGGRHEEFKYNGEGILVGWSADSLRSVTAGFINEVEVKFDPVSGCPIHCEGSGLNIGWNITLPSLPMVNLAFDGSTGNIKMHAAVGGNIDLDFGGGDDIKLKMTENGLKLKSELEAAQLKAKIETYSKPYVDTQIKSVSGQLSDLRFDTGTMAVNLCNQIAKIESEFQNQITEIKCQAASIKQIQNVQIVMQNVSLKNVKLELTQYAGIAMKA